MRKDPSESDPRREARLTDYLCGELEPAAARALEQELARDPELRARLEDLRGALEWVRSAAPAPAAELGEARRATLRTAAVAAAAERAAAQDGNAAGAVRAPAGRLLRLPVWARAAAGLLVLAGAAALLWDRGDEPLAAGETARLDEKKSAGRESQALQPLGYEGHPQADALALSAQPQPAPVPSEVAEEMSMLSELGYAGETGAGAAFQVRVDPLPAAEPLESLVLDPAGRENLALSAGIGGKTFEGPGDSSRYRLQPPDGAATPAQPASPGPPDPAAGFILPGIPDAEFDLRYADAVTLGGRHAGGAGAAEDKDEARRGLRAEPSSKVVDGYGRGYSDRAVLEHLRRRPDESPRDMFFRFYGDNAVVRAEEDRLSTFATDVDTASWALLRNYLAQGHVPPKAAVRTEECVNSFHQEFAPPAEDDFAITLEAAPTPYAPEGHVLLRCGLKAREVSRAARKPLNLVFVVDKSGSMEQENRLRLVQNALELLVDQIRDDDTIGIVAFDSEGHEILQPTAGAERWKIREALRRLQSGGSTNAGEGLFLGYAMAERAFRKEAANRVVLASDGVANTGETDQARILERVRRSAEAEVDLTTIGVGMGNHNDAFLERLADEGEGSCHYVDGMDEAKRVLVDGFTGAMQVVAREARVQVEFAPNVVREWRQLGYENRALADQDFRNERVDAGEIGAGHEMAALYELRLADGVDGPGVIATLRLRWKPDGAKEYVEREARIELGAVRSRWDLASPRFRLAGTVAQFAEFLRRSAHARGDSFAAVRENAARLARELGGDPQVTEFRDLVERAEMLVRRLWPEDELALLIEESRRARLAEAELECVQNRSERAEELLREVRRQNDAIESKLRELLDAPR